MVRMGRLEAPGGAEIVGFQGTAAVGRISQIPT
jgi:hypothetical protein